MNSTTFEYFDVEAYLQAKHISYDTGGKNVKSGWLGTQCLWCDDPSNHLGINPETKGINCFRCPTKGTIFKLIMKIELCSFKRAEMVVKEFSSNKALPLATEPDFEPLSRSADHILAPVEAQIELLNPHKAFLKKRNFEPHDIFEKYHLRSFAFTGRYKYRLFIPIYFKKRLVSYTTRDISDKASIPYLHCPKTDAVLYPKESLYNIDNCGDTAIVTEGVTDVWRIGDGAVATFGVIYTPFQMYLLRRFKRVFIMFDAEEEAQKMARQLAFDMSVFGPDVELLYLSEGDPADLKPDDVRHLRKTIFGKIY